MKGLLKILLLLISFKSYGQILTSNDSSVEFSQKDYKDSLIKYDFGSLWTETENQFVYGFIGKNYERIRIKIISATKEKKLPDTYKIYGKSMVKNNICQFNGTIKIDSIKIDNNMPLWVDGNYKDSGIKMMGVIIAEYDFMEDSTQLHSGVFKGTLSTNWYLDKFGRVRYDDTYLYADGFCNNQFAGTWKDYKNSLPATCNWGDFRIPFSKELDYGAGGFSPNEKYRQYGWESLCDMINSISDTTKAYKEAIKKEQEEWWK